MFAIAGISAPRRARIHRGLWCGGLLCAAWAVPAQAGPDITTSHLSVAVGRRRIAATVVRVPLSAYRIQVGLGQGLVACAEPLHAIARRYQATAAINGGYFAAYTRGPRYNPAHTLMTGGAVVHLGNIGTLLYTDGHQARMARVTVRLEGSLDGKWTWPDNWYAFWINRQPTASTITIFDRHWGRYTGIEGGTQVVVAHGRITAIAHTSQRIPDDGFVIYLRGQDALLSRFRVGRACAYRVVYADPVPAEWEHTREALGCGPRLVTDGRITVDAAGEGFRDPKVLALSTERSLAGITKSGDLLLVTTSGTIPEMAHLMLKLGAWQAMNLDGGASSGLWVRGSYLRRPGRDLTDALLIIKG